MAIALLSNSAFNGGANGATTAAIDTTGANLLIAAVTYYANPVSVTDSKGNTYTALTAITTAPSVQIWYCLSPTVGASHTVTVSGASTFSSVALLAFSGAAAFDKEIGASSDSPGSITPTNDNELLVAVATDTSNADFTAISGGFSIVAHLAGVGGSSLGCGVADLIQTTAAAASPTWTETNFNSNARSTMAAFTAAAAGFTPVFRKSFSMLGGRVGARQSWAA